MGQGPQRCCPTCSFCSLSLSLESILVCLKVSHSLSFILFVSLLIPFCSSAPLCPSWYLPLPVSVSPPSISLLISALSSSPSLHSILILTCLWLSLSPSVCLCLIFLCLCPILPVPLSATLLHPSLSLAVSPLTSLSKAADLDHHWVAKAWLNDIGLSQYSQAFQNHLVDGRMLNSLMKRDLEKHLNVSKKFHQVSILLGIELLYQVNFSRETLQERRARCETQNIDPVVWTNQRVLKWVRDIDLKEYADNLMNSGVHGAVLVLEPTFNAEAMATALGIPSGKHILRRHLAEEMSAIFHPANSAGIREAERFRTPPGRASSITRAGKEENCSAIKYKAGRLPLGKIGRGFSSKDPDFHDDYGSLQNEDCGDDDLQSRPEQCRLEGYNSLEVTNV
ncbi:kazrin-like [Loxodonta africana]|uniref:kazrin-like n=1 Tax=Loxodonta africana TaxID=9785 RepID=UPI0030CB7FF4